LGQDSPWVKGCKYFRCRSCLCREMPPTLEVRWKSESPNEIHRHPYSDRPPVAAARDVGSTPAEGRLCLPAPSVAGNQPNNPHLRGFALRSALTLNREERTQRRQPPAKIYLAASQTEQGQIGAASASLCVERVNSTTSDHATRNCNRTVVPAKAGDPRVSACAHRDAVSFDVSGKLDCLRLCRINEGLWLWVPAFAGTTLAPDGQITLRPMH
jgi:hypothetical protein